MPVMASPLETSRVSVPESELMREAPASVIRPESELFPEMLRRAPPLLMPVPTRLKGSAGVAMPPVSSRAAPLWTMVPAV